MIRSGSPGPWKPREAAARLWSASPRKNRGNSPGIVGAGGPCMRSSRSSSQPAGEEKGWTALSRPGHRPARESIRRAGTGAARLRRRAGDPPRRLARCDPGCWGATSFRGQMHAVPRAHLRPHHAPVVRGHGRHRDAHRPGSGAPVTLYGSQAGALDAGAGIGMAQP
jgi:hypothetical protein